MSISDIYGALHKEWNQINVIMLSAALVKLIQLVFLKVTKTFMGRTMPTLFKMKAYFNFLQPNLDNTYFISYSLKAVVYPFFHFYLQVSL